MVSVIVPARNEETALGACLESLTAQTGLTFEIIVVDDHSTDRTREIATSFPSIRLVEAPKLPHGWSGKSNAVAAGAAVARGEWFLFTDADTVHLPGSLSRSLSEAQQRKASLLSYSPEQEVHGVLEKAVMPVIFAELAATYRPSQVSDPKSAAAAANGQYLLMARDAYEAVGGHAAIAGSLLEDVALARNVKKSGRKIFFRYGADVVRTRMYRSFSQLREGWTKNLVLLFSAPVRLAVLRILEFLLIVGSLALAAIAVSGRRWQVAGFAAVIATVLYVIFLKRIRQAHFSWESDLLALFGLPLFSYLLLQSVISYRKGSVSWKGRDYGQRIPAQISDGRQEASATSQQGSSWSI
jgi:glycosyltransferase involved in cell wall biosynthesis